MFRKLLLCCTVAILASTLTAAELIPAGFKLLNTGNSKLAAVSEEQPGSIVLKMNSAKQNNYIVICYTKNIPVTPDTRLSYRVTPAERYADGAQFTVAVAYTVPGNPKWQNAQRPGTLLFNTKGIPFDLAIGNDFKLSPDSTVKQIKFVLNGMRLPEGKEINVTVSGLKVTDK